MNKKYTLDERYLDIKEMHDGDCTKLEFLSDHVFEITTYDSEIAEHFASLMLEVLQCLLENKTFAYIKDKAQYLNYLTMVNMPWLKSKIEWGTSIRGAWIQDNKDKEEIKNILKWVKE